MQCLPSATYLHSQNTLEEDATLWLPLLVVIEQLFRLDSDGENILVALEHNDQLVFV